MKILIIGNEGYIGPIVGYSIKQNHIHSWVAGFDIGYFAHTITAQEFPERNIDVQYRGDVREFPEDLLKGFDSVLYLAAISNDSMGKEFDLQKRELALADKEARANSKAKDKK